MFLSPIIEINLGRSVKRAVLAVTGTVLMAACSKAPAPDYGEDYPGKTVLLYQAGHNNLSSDFQTNIDSLKSGYVPDYFDETKVRGNALVVYNNSYNYPCLFRIYRRGGEVIYDTIKKYATMDDACDASVMKEILTTVFNRFPARERGVILSSHGTGWLPPMASVTKSTSDEDSGSSISLSTFGYDDRQRHEMEIYELRDALPFKMDYIIFDCCLMGGVETVYELRDKAEHIISSSAEILAKGFPYHKMMSHLLNATTAENWKAADLKGVAEEYYLSYAEERSEVLRSATISLVHTSGMETLAGTVRAILDSGGREEMKKLPTDEDGMSIDEYTIQRMFRRVNPYRHYYYDIKDLMDSICTAQVLAKNPLLLENFEKALSEAVEYRAATDWFLKSSNGFQIRTFCGLTMNIPYPADAEMDAYYKKLGWNAAAQVMETGK